MELLVLGFLFFTVALHFVAHRLAWLWDEQGPTSEDKLYWSVYRGLVFWGFVLVSPLYAIIIVSFLIHPILGAAILILGAKPVYKLGHTIFYFQLLQTISAGSQNETPQVGLVTHWNSYRPHRTKGPGDHLVFLPWPVRFWYIPIDVHRRNIDVRVNVRTSVKDEAILAVLTFGFVAIPDYRQPRRLPLFLRLAEGGKLDKGIEMHLEDVAGRFSVDTAAKTGWRNLYHKLDDMSASMIDYVTEGDTSNADQLAVAETEEEGRPDKFGWGLRILRIRGKNIELQGEFKRFADSIAIEKIRRQAQVRGQRRIQQIAKLITTSTPKTSKEKALLLATLMEAKDGLQAYSMVWAFKGEQQQPSLPILPLQQK